MRAAFHKNTGKLTDTTEPEAEREALTLFAGAIGRYKNRHSHRTVNVDQQSAREACVLASHLLRVVDSLHGALACGSKWRFRCDRFFVRAERPNCPSNQYRYAQAGTN